MLMINWFKIDKPLTDMPVVAHSPSHLSIMLGELRAIK